VVLVGGVAYAVTHKRGTPTCSQPWTPKGLTALATPGHYRIDVGVPQELVAKANVYPASEQEWEVILQKMAPQLPRGITVEGVWLPAVTINGQVRGPYSYPPNTPMPSDWPVPNDGLVHSRLQVIWPYKSDIAAALLGSYTTSELTKLGIVLQVLSCPTGPVPAAIPSPITWTEVPPDTHGSITFHAGGMWLLSAPPSLASIDLANTELAKKGFMVVGSWDATIPNDWPSSDSGHRWRFVVINDSTNDIVLDVSHGEKVFTVGSRLAI